MLKKIKIAIIGASGYTGVELIRILLNHQNAEIANLVASANAGKEIQEIYDGHSFARPGRTWPLDLTLHLPSRKSTEQVSLEISSIHSLAFIICLKD